MCIFGWGFCYQRGLGFLYRIVAFFLGLGLDSLIPRRGDSAQHSTWGFLNSLQRVASVLFYHGFYTYMYIYSTSGQKGIGNLFILSRFVPIHFHPIQSSHHSKLPKTSAPSYQNSMRCAFFHVCSLIQRAKRRRGTPINARLRSAAHGQTTGMYAVGARVRRSTPERSMHSDAQQEPGFHY